MRPIHMPHFHKPDWHHLRDQLNHLLHDPLFWSLLILALMFIVLLFLLAGRSDLPEPGPYMPVYPYAIA